MSSNGSTTLAVTSNGTAGSLNLDPATTGGVPVNFFDDGLGGTAVQFSTLSAASFADLKADIASAATLSAGTYEIYLTSSFVFANMDGTSDGLDSIQATNGATVVVNGQGFATSPLNFGSGAQALTVGEGPVEIVDLGGFVGVSVVGGAHLTVSSNGYAGLTTLVSGTVEDADPSGAGVNDIVFAGGGSETLQVDAAAQPSSGSAFANTISAFAGASMQYIDLAGYTFSSGLTTASVSSGMLAVTNGASVLDFALSGTPDQVLNTFDDGDGGTIVTMDSTACYVTGTSILTEAGERPVELLAVGDRLVTASGAVRPIRWIGHRAYHGRFLTGRTAMMPVCIRAGALGDGLPKRDLLVSPDHAMAIDGLLIPAAALVNGSSIVQARTVETVCYWHVELDSHDLLLAEGAAAESYLADGNRGMFHNHREAARPASPVSPSTGPCLPRVDQGPALEAIRRRLSSRSSALRAA